MTQNKPLVRYLLTVLVLFVLASSAYARGGREAGDRISPTDAFENVESGDAFFVDVRDEASYLEGHISGAIHIPLREIAGRAEELSADGRTIIAYCDCPAEESSLVAAADLIAAGVTNVYVLDGGIRAWAQADLPLQRGARP